MRMQLNNPAHKDGDSEKGHPFYISRTEKGHPFFISCLLLF